MTEQTDDQALAGLEWLAYVDEPAWYSRLTLPFRRSWRRELLTVAAVFAAGIVLGRLFH